MSDRNYWSLRCDPSQEQRLRLAVSRWVEAADAYKHARRLSNIRQRTPDQVEAARLRYVAAEAEYQMAHAAYWVGCN